MTDSLDWWCLPRKVSVVVDNPSWIIPYAKELVGLLNDNGDKAVFCQSYDQIEEGGVAFYLGCIKVTPKIYLEKNYYNLAVHESELPKGKGFAPLSWQILRGKNVIPICLLEAAEKVDSGAVIYRDVMNFKGNELNNEIRHIQGVKTIELCSRFMNEKNIPQGVSQQGDESCYERRRPEDSRLNIDQTLRDQFNLLRIVDNENYPAFFDLNGDRYEIHIHRVINEDERFK